MTPLPQAQKHAFRRGIAMGRYAGHAGCASGPAGLCWKWPVPAGGRHRPRKESSRNDG